MDKQKQIEEMAKIYDDATSYARNYLGSLNNAGKWYGNAFYNAGYRKIPEGAVVLEKPIYDYIMQGNRIIQEHARKETAEKFAERLKEKADMNMCLYGSRIVYVGEIDEICKEIMEGKV